MYIGRGTPQNAPHDEVTFKFFIKTLEKPNKNSGDKNMILSVRPHPRDEFPERYKEWAGDFPLFDTSEFPSGDDLLPIADLIVGIHSSHHIQACYLRIPAISILLENGGRQMLEQISLNDFPTNAVGATIGIYKESEEELKEVIEKIANDERFVAALKKTQEQYFPLPKTPAAERVAKEILIG